MSRESRGLGWREDPEYQGVGHVEERHVAFGGFVAYLKGACRLGREKRFP